MKRCGCCFYRAHHLVILRVPPGLPIPGEKASLAPPFSLIQAPLRSIQDHTEGRGRKCGGYMIPWNGVERTVLADPGTEGEEQSLNSEGLGRKS